MYCFPVPLRKRFSNLFSDLLHSLHVYVINVQEYTLLKIFFIIHFKYQQAIAILLE